jgi:TRAP-type C4-dicarboxylate transport system permease large subunit
MWGTLPFVGMMILAVILVSLVPDLALWMPSVLIR